MKKLFFLVFLVLLATSLYSVPFTPFPSPLLFALDVGFAHDFYEHSLSDSIYLAMDFHGKLGPEFSVYPGSFFPYLRAQGGSAIYLTLPFCFMLSLAADTGLLINPLIGFDTKWADLVYTAGLSGYTGFYYCLNQDIQIRFGGRLLFELFTSFIYPVPIRLYYSGVLVMALYFTI